LADSFAVFRLALSLSTSPEYSAVSLTRSINAAYAEERCWLESDILVNMSTTYEVIMAKVRALTRKAEYAKRAHDKRLARAVERIRKLMKEHGVSIGHLSGSASGRAAASAKVGKSKLPPTDGRLKVKPKYRHPKSKETWSGRGKTPRWLVAEMKSGKSKDSFLIKSK